MKKWSATKNLKIQTRFFVYFAVFALVPAIILGIVLGALMLGNRADNTRATVTISMENSVQRLRVLNEVLQIGLTVSEDKDIIDMMDRHELDDTASARRIRKSAMS